MEPTPSQADEESTPLADRGVRPIVIGLTLLVVVLAARGCEVCGEVEDGRALSEEPIGVVWLNANGSGWMAEGSQQSISNEALGYRINDWSRRNWGSWACSHGCGGDSLETDWPKFASADETSGGEHRCRQD